MAMTDILLSPIRLSELETLIKNSVSQALEAQAKDRLFNPPAPQDIIFDVPELAKYLRCKADTIYTNIDKYPRIKDGKSWKFFKSEIDNYLKENRVKSKSELMEGIRQDAELQLEVMRNKTKK
jgi:hypothetical protein